MDYAFGSFNSTIDAATGGFFAPPAATVSLGPQTQHQYSADVTLTGAFDVFGRRTEIAIGGDYMRFKSRYGISDYPELEGGIVPNVAAYNPALYPDPRVGQVPALRLERVSTYSEGGTYLTAKMHLDEDWSLVGGARVSSDHFYNIATFPSAPGYRLVVDLEDNNVVTPYGAVIYDFNQHYTLYASYADIFQTLAQALRPDGSPLGAEHGHTAEVGFKTAWRDGRLNGMLAAYQIKQYGAPIFISASNIVLPGCCYTTGVNESSGFDLQLDGSPVPGWDLGSGYSYNANHSAAGGQLSSWTPRNLLKVWTSNRLPGGLNRWTVGGNLHIQSDSIKSGTSCLTPDLPDGICSTYTPYLIHSGSYTVVDLRVGFQIDAHWRASLAVNNVFDRIYYESLGTPTGDNWYGEPRNVLLQVRGSF